MRHKVPYPESVTLPDLRLQCVHRLPVVQRVGGAEVRQVGHVAENRVYASLPQPVLEPLDLFLTEFSMLPHPWALGEYLERGAADSRGSVNSLVYAALYGDVEAKFHGQITELINR